MTKQENIKIAGEVINLLRKNGIVIESPYDVENWAEEWLTNHSNLFETKMFKEE